MKKQFTLLCLSVLLSFSKSYCQNFEIFGQTKFYELVVPTFVVENKPNATPILAAGKLKFTVLKIDSNGDYIIQFWKWTGENQGQNLDKSALYIYQDITKLKNNVISDELDNLKIFKLSAEDFKNNAIPYHSAGLQRGALDWSSGLVVLPIKSRNKPNFTYSKDITLGLSGGAKMRISHRNPTYLNFLINLGIASVSVDSLSSSGKIKQPSDRAALTTAFGVVLENHSFQFGVFVGRDKLSANDAKNTGWIYNNKPWISFGLGYQILTASDKNKDTKAGKN